MILISEKDVSKPIVCINILAWSAGVCIHHQCGTNLSKLIVYKLHTKPHLLILTSKLLPSIADRSLNRYDIWQLGYSPIKLNEWYIALEKYPRKYIAKLLKGGFASGFKITKIWL